MARIAGIVIPPNKRLVIALTYIYGIGPTTANKIISDAKLSPDLKPKDLTEDQEKKLRDEVEKKYRVEGELRREKLANIKRLKEIGSYRGSRHIKGLPVRGQRTKTNSRSVRGNMRKTMGSGKRKLEKT